MLKNKLAIVIPAYNEENTIDHVITECSFFGDVIVVNDYSKDQTKLVAKNSGAIVIDNQKNMGYEYSLYRGLMFAISQNYDFAITMDADGQLPASKIPEFYKGLFNHYLVVGNRLHKPRLAEQIAAFFSRKIFQLKDPFCGMKAYNLEILRGQKIFTTKSIGTEIAIRLCKNNRSILNVNIETEERIGESKFGKNDIALNMNFLYHFFKTITISKAL